MEKSVILLDGATGTNLWAMAAARGIARVPVWQYNLTHPELVRGLAGRFAAAGSRILLANTFCANRPSAAPYPAFQVGPVVAAGVRVAREACGDAHVALSVAPLPGVPGDRAERLQAAADYDEQMAAGVSAGADLIFLETFWEPTLLLIAAERAAQFGLPVLYSMTFEARGVTFGGVTPEGMVKLVEPYHPAAVGLNCSWGPADSLPILRQFGRKTDLPLIYKPNAGEHDPVGFARAMEPALELARYVGGCCGTVPADIAALKERIDAV